MRVRLSAEAGRGFYASTNLVSTARNLVPVSTPGRKVGTTLDNGTVFRVVSFGPGVTPRNHRTDSIDYGTVISGEINMELDGTSVHLKAGDLLVQRGTIHN